MATGGTEEPRDLRVLEALHHLAITTETVPYQYQGQREGMQGIFCKNLLLKDRKGQFYLVVCPEGKNVDLKTLKQDLKAHQNFSFSTTEDLESLLGCCPGAVSPLGVIHDTGNKVRVVIDSNLRDCTELLNFHPLDQKLTTLIYLRDLLMFLEHFDHHPLFVPIEHITVAS